MRQSCQPKSDNILLCPLAHFCFAVDTLCQFYSGSRPRTVAKTTWDRRDDGPWIDIENATWWRAGDEEVETVKARRPHGIPPRLLAHLKRWKKNSNTKFIVEHPRKPGEPIYDIGKALEGAASRAGVKRITPHTLKHTAITLAIQSGMTAEDASDYFSTSIETIQSNYWHHSPKHKNVQSRRWGILADPMICNETQRNDTIYNDMRLHIVIK